MTDGLNGPDNVPAARRDGRRIALVVVIAVVILGIVAAVAYKVGRYVERGVAARPGPASDASIAEGVQPPPPFTLRLDAGTAVEIPARESRDYRFPLPEPAGDCLVTGRVVGVSGGDKDFELLILTDDDYQNWVATKAYRSIWESGQVTVRSFEEHVRAPGVYHFVVSNVFSLLTTKVVTVTADVSCPR